MEVEIDGPEIDDLPPNWVKKFDKDKQKWYYKNKISKKTQWTFPKAQEQEEILSTMDMFSEQSVIDHVEDDVNAYPAHVSYESSLLADQSQWAEVLDDESGQIYYYNSSTGETSWERPESIAEDFQEDPMLNYLASGDGVAGIHDSNMKFSLPDGSDEQVETTGGADSTVIDEGVLQQHFDYADVAEPSSINSLSSSHEYQMPAITASSPHLSSNIPISENISGELQGSNIEHGDGYGEVNRRVVYSTAAASMFSDARFTGDLSTRDAVVPIEYSLTPQKLSASITSPRSVVSTTKKSTNISHGTDDTNVQQITMHDDADETVLYHGDNLDVPQMNTIDVSKNKDLTSKDSGLPTERSLGSRLAHLAFLAPLAIFSLPALLALPAMLAHLKRLVPASIAHVVDALPALATVSLVVFQVPQHRLSAFTSSSVIFVSNMKKQAQILFTAYWLMVVASALLVFGMWFMLLLLCIAIVYLRRQSVHDFEIAGFGFVLVASLALGCCCYYCAPGLALAWKSAWEEILRSTFWRHSDARKGAFNVLLDDRTDRNRSDLPVAIREQNLRIAFDHTTLTEGGLGHVVDSTSTDSPVRSDEGAESSASLSTIQLAALRSELSMAQEIINQLRSILRNMHQEPQNEARVQQGNAPFGFSSLANLYVLIAGSPSANHSMDRDGQSTSVPRSPSCSTNEDSTGLRLLSYSELTSPSLAAADASDSRLLLLEALPMQPVPAQMRRHSSTSFGEESERDYHQTHLASSSKASSDRSSGYNFCRRASKILACCIILVLALIGAVTVLILTRDDLSDWKLCYCASQDTAGNAATSSNRNFFTRFKIVGVDKVAQKSLSENTATARSSLLDRFLQLWPGFYATSRGATNVHTGAGWRNCHCTCSDGGNIAELKKSG